MDAQEEQPEKLTNQLNLLNEKLDAILKLLLIIVRELKIDEFVKSL